MRLPIVYNPIYSIPWPSEHRFPMSKFEMLYGILQKEEIIDTDNIHTPDTLPVDVLSTIHDGQFVKAFCEGTIDPKAQRKIGLPWSPQLVTRTLTALGGSLLTAELAIRYGLACNTAGGTHHAFNNFGSGFCVFNDLSVVANIMLKKNLARKILIIDLDVHQGDGTASMLEHEADAFTFSMHCEKNFPFVKQKSDLDIALPEGTGDEEYLSTLEAYLDDVISAVRPDLVIYDAGVDPHTNDPLGKMSLTSEGLLKRDKFVLRQCLKKGIAVSCVIGGGYSKDLTELANRHSIIHRAASEAFVKHGL